jgi:hypothetical protein
MAIVAVTCAAVTLVVLAPSRAQGPPDPAASHDAPGRPADPAAADASTRDADADADASYALGFVIAHRLAEAGIRVDPASLQQGFRDAHESETPRLDPAAMRDALQTLLKTDAAASADAHADRRPAAATDRAAADRPVRSAIDAPTVARPQATPFSLRLDGQVPGQRITTAVPTTRRNTYEADTEVRP